MQNKLIIFAGILGMLLFTSCADPEKSPIITFDKAGKGAYIRLVKLTSGEFDLANVASSKYEYEVEFVDIEQGKTVSSFELFATYIDNNPDNGDDSKDQTLYKSFGTGDFSTNTDGFVGLSISIPATDIISKMGLDVNNLKAGDIFKFESVLTTSGGSVHTGANSTSTVNGSAFAGWFDFDAKVTCPLEDTEFAGSYKLTYAAAPTGAYGEIFGEDPGTVTLAPVDGSTTLRKFDIDYLPGIGPFGITVTIDFVCDQVVMPTVDTGVGCGGSITISQGDVTPFDLEDDSEFVLNMIEFTNDGGCGVDEAPVTITFTKQ